MNQPVLPQQGDRIGYVLSGKVLNALVISASVGSNRNTNQKYIEAHREWQAAGGRADTQPQPPQEVSLSLCYIDPTLGVVVKLNGVPEANEERNTGWVSTKAEIDPVGTIKNAIRLLQTSTEGVDAELQRIADEGARKDREHIPVVGQIGEGKAAIHHKKPDPVATGDAPADPTDPHQQDVGPDWSGAKKPSAEDLDAHAQEMEAAEATTAGAVLQSEEAQ